MTTQLHRALTVLSDGRDLLYYDDHARTDLPADTRRLDSVVDASDMRHDALVDEWVVIAGHRQARTFQPSADARTCPLCPSTPENQSEIPASCYQVAVFENRFPSLSRPPDGWTLPVGGIHTSTDNAGRCEVICFTDDHTSSFAELSEARIRLVIDAWADRTAALSRLPFVAIVFPFENCGAEIGVTIAHPHGQIYAYPTLPPRARALITASRAHERATGRHLIQDVIDAEVADGSRMIEQTEHWASFVPYAARWPYQVQLHPRRHVYDLAELTENERDDLAGMHLRTLKRLHGLFNLRMPYIAAWHQAPIGEEREFGRLHLDLFTSRRTKDKLKYLAGSEAAMGAFINDVTPESAARQLRGDS